MSKKFDCVSRIQLTALAFISMLSPTVQRVPGQISALSGRASWVSALLTTIPVIITALLYSWLRKRTGPLSGEEIVIGALGRGLGRIVLALTGLWLIIYCAFLLCAGADRFIATIFPNTRPTFLILVMLFMCLIAALGELRALARTAMVFRPIILLVLIFVAICALPDVDFNELLPPFEDGVAPAFKGVLPLMNIAAISFYFIFLEDHTDGRFSVKGFLPWALTYVVITLFLCIYVLGTLGLELTRNLAHPFFAVIRELSIFSALERIESVIVGLWVFPDFILISVMLKIAAKLLCRGFGLQEPGAEGLPLLSLRSSRWLVWLCAIMAGIAALIVGGNSFALLWCSLKLIPWLHMIFAAIIIPLCCIIWCMRNRRTAK